MYRLVFHNVTEGDWHGIRFVNLFGGQAASIEQAKRVFLPEADSLFNLFGVSLGGSRLIAFDDKGFNEVVTAHVGLEMRDSIARLIREGHAVVLKVFADDPSFHVDVSDPL
jgi:hypothetical protein